MQDERKTLKVFCDTNVLLNSKFNLQDYQKVYISIVSIEELDKLKRDERISYQARKIIKDIKFADNVVIITKSDFNTTNRLFLEHGNDNAILNMAYDVFIDDNEVLFLSDDYNLIVKADKGLGLPCKMFEFKDDKSDDIYTGYKEVCISEDEELAKHYETSENRWGLLNNEYLIIKDKDGNVVDKQRYVEGKGFVQLNSKGFKSIYFGDIKPRDVYQIMAIDSLNNSDFTLLFGKSGSAKTLLSLSWIMHNIQLGKINKAVIVFNSVPLKNNKSQGFYPGDRNQKLLQSSLGGILSSKFGDMTIVESLITQGKLLLIPSAEIRGIEISDSDVIFVTEAQNTDIYTMKTIIQRAKGKIIVEGDMLEQQDLIHSNNRDNGMRRVIEVFKGSQYFSCVKLKNRYRHPMGDLADKM